MPESPCRSYFFPYPYPYPSRGGEKNLTDSQIKIYLRLVPWPGPGRPEAGTVLYFFLYPPPWEGLSSRPTDGEACRHPPPSRERGRSVLDKYDETLGMSS